MPIPNPQWDENMRRAMEPTLRKMMEPARQAMEPTRRKIMEQLWPAINPKPRAPQRPPTNDPGGEPPTPAP